MLGLQDLTAATRPPVDLGHHGVGAMAGQPALPTAYDVPVVNFAPPMPMPAFASSPIPVFGTGVAPANPSGASGAGGGGGGGGGGGAGKGGSVWDKLARGFQQVGASQLAHMARNQAPALAAWLRQESGLRGHVVSPANNQGLPNGGVFQFWRGHPWAAPYFHGTHFTMPVATQAADAVRYFHLTPEDVRRYAAQIRSGSYRGWG